MFTKYRSQFTGSVASKPEFHYAANGMAVIRFRVTQGRRDPDHYLCQFGASMVAFGSTAEDLNKILGSGDPVTVSGYFQTRFYFLKDKPKTDDNKRYDDSFIVQKIIVERDGREIVIEEPLRERKPVAVPATA